MTLPLTNFSNKLDKRNIQRFNGNFIQFTPDHNGNKESLLSKETSEARPTDNTGLDKFYLRVKGHIPFVAVNCVFSELLMPYVAEKILLHTDLQSGFSPRLDKTREFVRAIVFYGIDSYYTRDLIIKTNLRHLELGIDPQHPEFSYVFYTLTTKFIDGLKQITPKKIGINDEIELRWYKMWSEVSKLMGCTLPSNYQDFKDSNLALQDRQQRETSAVSKEAANYFLESLSQRIPLIPKVITRRFISSLVEKNVADAFKLPQPQGIERESYLYLKAVSACLLGSFQQSR